MATRQDDEGGSRIWRGVRALIFGEDHEATLRDQIEDAIDEADAEPLKRGDLNPVERQMLRNLLHFGDRTVGEVAVTRGDIVSVPSTISFDSLIAAFAEAEHSRLPVTGDGLDEVIGMIHIKDVFKAQQEPGRPRTIEGLLRTPLYVPNRWASSTCLPGCGRSGCTSPSWSTNSAAPRGSSRSRMSSRKSSARSRTSMTSRRPACSTLLDDGLWEADARIELEDVAARRSTRAWRRGR